MLALHGGNDAATPGVGGEHMLIQNLQLMRGEIIGTNEQSYIIYIHYDIRTDGANGRSTVYTYREKSLLY